MIFNICILTNGFLFILTNRVNNEKYTRVQMFQQIFEIPF